MLPTPPLLQGPALPVSPTFSLSILPSVPLTLFFWSRSLLYLSGAFSYSLLQRLTPYAETSAPIPSVDSPVSRAVTSIPDQRSQNARGGVQLCLQLSGSPAQHCT